MKLLAAIRTIGRVSHYFALLLIISAAVVAVVYTGLSVLGLTDWLYMPITLGETVYPLAGVAVQSILTAALVTLVFVVPTNARVMSLEQSHRSFQLKMEDVARAYHLCHTADRSGVFTMSSEFDAVRERMAYLRDHPDLERLEPEVLEVAAQMSQQARHLADVYSDEKVTRAKTFLRQRQEEAEKQQDRIVEALHVTQQLSKWAQQVELEESIVASQLSQLDERLQATLPELGYTLGRSEDNIVSMPQKIAAE